MGGHNNGAFARAWNLLWLYENVVGIISVISYSLILSKPLHFIVDSTNQFSVNVECFRDITIYLVNPTIDNLQQFLPARC